MDEFIFNEESKEWEFKDKSLEKDYRIELEPKYDNQGVIWAHWPKKIKR